MNVYYQEFKIQSIEFINARTRVIKCVVNRMSLDITANQRSTLASAVFLEEAARAIGNNDLYKRSVLLVKVHHSQYHPCVLVFVYIVYNYICIDI